jgi:hypothetical protein
MLRVVLITVPLCLTIQLLSPCHGWFAIGLGPSSLWCLTIWLKSVVRKYGLVLHKPRVVFFSVRLFKKPNCANGLFDSLPIDCHCPVLSMSDAKPAKLPLLLLSMLISEKHSEGRREAAGEG